MFAACVRLQGQRAARVEGRNDFRVAGPKAVLVRRRSFSRSREF